MTILSIFGRSEICHPLFLMNNPRPAFSSWQAGRACSRRPVPPTVLQKSEKDGGDYKEESVATLLLCLDGHSEQGSVRIQRKVCRGDRWRGMLRRHRP